MVRTATPQQTDPENDISVQATLIVNRVDALQARLEQIANQNDAGIRRLDSRLENVSSSTDRRFQDFESSVRQLVLDGMDKLREPLEQTSSGFQQVNERLTQVEGRQVETTKTLDERLGEIAYQTRLAMVGGGLVMIAAIVIMLLR